MLQKELPDLARNTPKLKNLQHFPLWHPACDLRFNDILQSSKNGGYYVNH